MSIASLIQDVREDIIDDVGLQKRLSDSQLTRFANEAIKEACMRAPLLVATKTFKVIAGKSEYELDEFTRQIIDVKFSLSPHPLRQETDDGLSLNYGSDWKLRAAPPTHYTRLNRVLRIYPIPVVDDVLAVKMSRIPDDDFDLDEDIDPSYYDSFKYYVAYKAFSQRDNDNYDPVKASSFLELFNSMFGTKHSAKYDTVNFNTPMYATVTSGRMC